MEELADAVFTRDWVSQMPDIRQPFARRYLVLLGMKFLIALGCLDKEYHPTLEEVDSFQWK